MEFVKHLPQRFVHLIDSHHRFFLPFAQSIQENNPHILTTAAVWRNRAQHKVDNVNPRTRLKSGRGEVNNLNNYQ